MEKKAPLIFHSDWFDIINDLPEELQLDGSLGVSLKNNL